jgi:hypothetical protein
MAWLDPRAYGRATSPRARKMLVPGASVATLVGLTVLVTGGFAQPSDESPDVVAAAKKKGFVPACTQRSGHNESKGDLNIRLREFCAKGQKPLKLATWPLKGKRGPQGPQGPQGPPGPPSGGGSADEYGVANVFVQRGSGERTRWATYSVTLGSPVGATTGGHFRFTCTQQHVRCKVSIGAAVLSNGSGRAVVHPRIIIHRQDATSSGTPMTYCEYVDGDANQISRVPLRTAVGEIREPLRMDAGGSFDCGGGQTGTPARAEEIWVPTGSPAADAYYDVWTTLTFGR